MANNKYVINGDQLIAGNIFLTMGQKEVLKGATLSVSKGSITGLLGRNGAGKSVMLQCIFGTLQSAECDVLVNGVRIGMPYAMQGLLNYLPQTPFLPQQLIVKKVLHQYNVAQEVVFGVFPEMEQEQYRPIHELAGGIQRLLSVVIILLAETRFSLLDEPFAHIMPLHVGRLQALLVQQQVKKGIVITDSNYQRLQRVCNQLYLLKDGQSIFIREEADLPLHGYPTP